MSLRTRKNVGLIGLGVIGQRVAENLRQRGFHVFVWNRTPRPVPNFVGSPAEVAELCDYIQLFVSDDDALLQMAERLRRSLTSQHIVMAHSTVSPDTMRAAAELVQRRGARFLDAPFTGSKTAAQKGELVYYLGGDPTTIQQARPVLEASSKEILEIGEVGDATIIKVATNMITAASVQAAAEALSLVHKSGLAVDKFVAAMRNNGSNSSTLEMKLPMMIEGNFERHFSVRHMLKDIAIATRLARSLGLEFGATDAARHALAEEVRRGREEDDYSSIIRNYIPEGEPLRNVEPVSEVAEVHPTFAGIEQTESTAEEISENGSAEVSEVSTPEITAIEESRGQTDEKSVTSEPGELEKPTEFHTVHEPTAAQIAALFALRKSPDASGDEIVAESKMVEATNGETGTDLPAAKAMSAASESESEAVGAETVKEPKTVPTVRESPAPVSELETKDEVEDSGGIFGGFWHRRGDD